MKYYYLLTGVAWVQVYESLTEIMKGINGVKVENNKFCVSVHYRCANEEVCLLFP